MDLTDLTKHYSVPGGDAFDVTPEAAIDYFAGKGLKPTFAWQDMIGQEHAHAFTVAKMMDVDLLAEVQESLKDALTTGKPFREWADDLVPTLQAKGWWGRKAVIDPLTGQAVVAQLGSPHRLATIFRTNLQGAYAQGQWDLIEAQAEEAPYLLYDAIDDYRTRPEHAAWDGTLLPVKSNWWKTHTPPCGWNCRCSVIQLNEDEIEELGLEPQQRPPAFSTYSWTNPRTGQVFEIPRGVDPGFGQAAAKRIDNIQTLLAEKLAALPGDLKPFAAQGVQATVSLADEAAAAHLELVKSIGQRNLARAGAKLEKLGAEIEIQNAKAEGVPYLAAALKKLTGKHDNPIDLIKAAKAEAAKAKQSAMLKGWKDSYLNEKAPTKAQQEAFDNLPGEAQASLVADLQAQLTAKKAEAAAAAKLADIETNPKGQTLKNQILAKLKKAGEDKGLTSVDLLAKVEQQYATEQAKKQAASALSGYKAKILEGKVPTPAQKAAFDALTPEEQEAFLVKIEKEKAKKLPPQEPEVTPQPAATSPADDGVNLDGSNMTQIGPQAGSNPGGLFQDVTTGEKWYVKWPNSVDNARNEALTAALYRLGGIESVEYRLTVVNGKEGIASRYVEGLKQDADALQSGKQLGIADGFGFDAWLANRDVIGMSYDNLKVLGNRAVRVDTGGGLRYRAQGGLKGDQFGDKVVEIDTLRDPRYNSQAASVFGKLSESQIEDSVRRVLAIDDDDIRRTVEAWGPLDLKERDSLLKTLLARKADLAARFPNARPVQAKPAPVADANRVVTKVEQDTIEAARSNGYALRTDGGDIEDHNVTVSVFDTTDGKLTRAHLKVLPKAGERIEKQVAKSAGEPALAVDTTSLAPKILELVKGINSRAAKGGALEQKNVDRWNTLKPQLTQALLDLAKQRGRKGIDQKLVESQIDAVGQWSVRLEKALTGKGADDIAQAVEGKFDPGIFTAIYEAAVTEGGGLPWKKLKHWQVPVAQVSKGFGKIGTSKQNVPGVDTVYRAELDGVTIDYVPFKGNDSGRAFQGTVHIDVKGASVEATERAVRLLEDLGIKSHRATELDRKELYVNKMARLYTVRDTSREQQWAAFDTSHPDQQARVDAKIAWLNKVTGKDITKSDQWGTYSGTYQAFGHGRALQMRPDLDDAEFNAFTKDYVLYNNPTGLGTSARAGMWERVRLILEGGGTYSSRADMVRRGLPMSSGTSVEADISTGGGNYIFTRIRKKGGTGAGIYWKADHLRRLDAISYPGDLFGNTNDATQRHSRKVTIAEWKGIAGNDGNETIFKDGLSLFDGVEKIVFPSKEELAQALDWFKSNGYDRWPDGRKLEEVLKGK